MIAPPFPRQEPPGNHPLCLFLFVIFMWTPYAIFFFDSNILPRAAAFPSIHQIYFFLTMLYRQGLPGLVYDLNADLWHRFFLPSSNLFSFHRYRKRRAIGDPKGILLFFGMFFILLSVAGNDKNRYHLIYIKVIKENQPLYPVERYVTIGEKKYCFMTVHISRVWTVNTVEMMTLANWCMIFVYRPWLYKFWSLCRKGKIFQAWWGRSSGHV